MRFSLLCSAFSLFFVNSEAGLISGFGAEGGLSLTSQKWDYKSDSMGDNFMKDWDQHYNAGVFLQFFDYKYVNLIFDVSYNQKGGLTKGGIAGTKVDSLGALTPGATLDIGDRLDYISFAPRVKLKYPMGKFEPFFTIGPSFDFLVHKTSQFVETDIFKKYDVSTPYGVGVGMHISSHLYSFFEFLHQPSIIPIYSNSNLDIMNDGVKFNFGLQYML